MGEPAPEQVAFSLLDERWIEVVRRDGPTRLGILDVFRQAAEIRDLADPSPLVAFSVHRLLLAILRWMEPERDVATWRALWNRGCFDAALVDGLAVRGRGLFNLFDRERPFYQDASARPNRPVSDLAVDVPGDTTIAHFWHSQDRNLALCPTCCARGLALLPPFCTSGGSGKKPSINERPPVYVLLRGDNLFRTLVLNLPVPGALPDWVSADVAGDRPAWEGMTAGRGAVGFMEGLTWQPRRVKLAAQPAGGQACSRCGESPPTLVKGEIAFHKGRPPPRDRKWEDPHAGRERKRDETVPLRPPAEPSPWFWRRVARAVLGGDATGQGWPPAVRQLRCLVQAGTLAAEGLPDLAIRSTAFYTSQMRYTFAEAEDWPLPAILFVDDERRAVLLEALKIAEEIGREVDRGAIKPGKSRNARQEFRTAAYALRHLEATARQDFRDLLLRAATGERRETLLSWWSERLRRTAAGTVAPAVAASCHLADIGAGQRLAGWVTKARRQRGEP